MISLQLVVAHEALAAQSSKRCPSCKIPNSYISKHSGSSSNEAPSDMVAKSTIKTVFLIIKHFEEDLFRFYVILTSIVYE